MRAVNEFPCPLADTADTCPCGTMMKTHPPDSPEGRVDALVDAGRAARRASDAHS
jgi:hypothetical protein